MTNLTIDKIINETQSYLSNRLPPYLYNTSFVPGESTVLYSGPFWDDKEIVAGLNAFLTGKWIVAGENVHRFEKSFANYFNVGHAHMVNSGSSANLVLISALKKYYKWKDQDEIIVSPVGFPTSISVLVQNNLKPVFVDIEYNTLNFDVGKIEEKITSKTKAIFVSPVLANPPDMDYLTDLCKKYDLLLIGDSCDSIGTKWDNKHLSDYYTAWTSSFYPAHHISTGEGGMVCTNNPELKKLFVSFSWWGRDCYCVGPANLLSCGSCGNRFDRWLESYDGIIDHKYVFNNIGYNLKPLDMQGAIGVEQLKKFDEICVKRKNSKQNIENILLKYVNGIKGVTTLDKASPSWFGTPFICENKDLKFKLVSFLEENKIQTRNYFAGNILLHPGFSYLGNVKEYPQANKVLDKVFFIGAAPHYNQDVFDYIDNVFAKKWTQ
jgi:CDP-4-dehydro-6-deoxyglucose reductase, E1